MDLISQVKFCLEFATKRAFCQCRWVPLYSNVDNPNSRIIQSLLSTHLLSPLWESPHLIQNWLIRKEFCFVYLFRTKRDLYTWMSFLAVVFSSDAVMVMKNILNYFEDLAVWWKTFHNGDVSCFFFSEKVLKDHVWPCLHKHQKVPRNGNFRNTVCVSIGPWLQFRCAPLELIHQLYWSYWRPCVSILCWVPSGTPNLYQG